MKSTKAENARRQREFYRANQEAVNYVRREKYEDLKAQGLCPKCGGEPVPGKVLCAACQKKYRDQKRRRDARGSHN